MTEAEYVEAISCCAQLFWMRQTLKDYGYAMNQVIQTLVKLFKSFLCLIP
jgi:hypothetical protein